MSDVVRRCVQLLGENLPPGWSIVPVDKAQVDLSGRVDATLRVVDADGVEAILAVEAKRSLERRDVPAVETRIRRYTASLPNAWGVVAARYLTPSVREALIERGLSYIDTTGNERLTVASPGLFVSNRGADKDPWRSTGRPRGTLKGAPATKVVRALIDVEGPWKIRDLIQRSGASTGATYRVVDYLEREELLVREPTGALVLGSWRRLLQEWSKDYGFVRSNSVTRYIEPRGLPALLERVKATSGVPYAVTGSLAAAEWAAYAPTRAAQIYVPDSAQAAKLWGLRPTDTGANVLLAEPETDVVFKRTVTNSEGLVIATPAQVAVDLLTGPGRNPSEAEELMDWMERNEPSWRL